MAAGTKVAARPTRAAMERECMKKWGKHMLRTGQVHVIKRASESFVKLGLYYLELGKDQASFQTNQSISQFFVGLHWILPLTNLFP